MTQSRSRAQVLAVVLGVIVGAGNCEVRAQGVVSQSAPGAPVTTTLQPSSPAPSGNSAGPQGEAVSPSNVSAGHLAQPALGPQYRNPAATPDTNNGQSAYRIENNSGRYTVTTSGQSAADPGVPSFTTHNSSGQYSTTAAGPLAVGSSAAASPGAPSTATQNSSGGYTVTTVGSSSGDNPGAPSFTTMNPASGAISTTVAPLAGSGR